jgi:ABC-type nitrate/sulfonate/bicarbonate transport system substrate-binding protein
MSNAERARGESLNRKRIPLLVVVAAVVAVVIAACGSSTSSSSSSAVGSSNASAKTGPTTIRYQAVPGSLTPVEFASYLGYLPGLKIQQVGTVLGGPADIQGVATNSSDIGGAFNGSIVAAIAAGAQIKAVVGYYGSNNLTYGGVYVKSSSPIHTAKDLIGKSVGVNTLGANATEVVSLWLAKEGLTPSQIKQVNFVVVSPTSAAEALQTGRLDAAFLSFATRQLALKTGGVRELMTDTGLLGPYTGGSDVLRTSFIQQYPKTATELVTGVAKAIHWLQVTPRATVIKTALKIAVLHGRNDGTWIPSWRSQGVLETGAYIKPVDFTRWIQAMEISGQLKQGQVSLSRLYTNEFNPYTPH